MSNPIWPAQLPQYFFLGPSDERRSAFASFSVDSGPAARRLMRRGVPRDLSTPLMLTQEQRLVFDEFFIETLAEGTLPFDWTDPVTLLTLTYRFMKYPSFSQNPIATTTLHVGTLELETV